MEPKQCGIIKGDEESKLTNEFKVSEATGHKNCAEAGIVNGDAPTTHCYGQGISSKFVLR